MTNSQYSILNRPVPPSILHPLFSTLHPLALRPKPPQAMGTGQRQRFPLLPAKSRREGVLTLSNRWPMTNSQCSILNRPVPPSFLHPRPSILHPLPLPPRRLAPLSILQPCILLPSRQIYGRHTTRPMTHCPFSMLNSQLIYPAFIPPSSTLYPPPSPAAPAPPRSPSSSCAPVPRPANSPPAPDRLRTGRAKATPGSSLFPVEWRVPAGGQLRQERHVYSRNHPPSKQAPSGAAWKGTLPTRSRPGIKPPTRRS